MKVTFARCNFSDLSNVPIVDGQMVLAKDTYDMFVDVNSKRLKVSDIAFLPTVADRDNIQAPISNKLYFVVEDCNLYYFNGTSWTSIAEAIKANQIQFDNTNTTMQSTTVQGAILELYNKIGEIGTMLDTINGEVI